MKTFDQTEYEQWLTTQRQDLPCDIHPEVKRQLDLEGTRARAERNPHNSAWWRTEYFKCPVCREHEFQSKLSRCGVSEVNIACTLDNWIPRNDQETTHLETVREFAEKTRIGFLFLLGGIGLGKTHLGVGVLRRYSAGAVFIKQSTLLRELRATYSDKQAKDPIERCKAASLLVLDEMGLSSGGRVEAPMLHEILDHRYSEKLPTVITSNLSWDELKAELGDRLSDRLKESAFAVLLFSGPSHRTECRDQYFDNRNPRPVDTSDDSWRVCL
jgi:DNA replication protein DnaC